MTQIVVNHLTRMEGPRICVAGLDPGSRKHLRPVVGPGRALTRASLAGSEGPFELGVVVELGETAPQPDRPETEDVLFEPQLAKRIGRLPDEEYLKLVDRVSDGSVEDAFGPDLQRRGWTYAVDLDEGECSLGCVRVRVAPELEVSDRFGERLQLRFNDPSRPAFLPVNDLRFYEERPSDLESRGDRRCRGQASRWSRRLAAVGPGTCLQGPGRRCRAALAAGQRPLSRGLTARSGTLILDDDLIRRYRTARRDPGLAVVEGFHALKHALRFGAEVVEAVAVDPSELERLAADLAPDLVGELAARTVPVPPEVLAELVPLAPRTGVVAIAHRPRVDVATVLADARPAPLVLLEEPRNIGNLGACVRVAAAADAAGVFATGFNDPWHPDALRAGAGLHFSLPVALVEELPGSDRPLIAVDPDGDVLRPAQLPLRAVFAFGSERDGLSPSLLERADARLGIPMPSGVSSLNLATAVSAVLFAQRLAPRADAG